ncbi:MAG: lysophospholipid acyltransferase family protein [Pacificimonas sp.]
MKATLSARLFRRCLLWIYRRGRWTVTGSAPAERKFVLIAVPHTTGMDLPNLLGAGHDLGVDLHFMAKRQLFRWPLGRFLRGVGGVPVDRSRPGGMVAQMAAEFAARDEFVLTIAPEGTRERVKDWKSGFYRIAEAADVPIVCGYMDYEGRRVGLGPVIHPTGNYEDDMTEALAFYDDVLPGGYAGRLKTPA